MDRASFDLPFDAAVAREVRNRGRLVRRSDMVEYCGSEDKADALLKRLVRRGILAYHKTRKIYASGQGWTLTTTDGVYQLSDVGLALIDIYPNKDGRVAIH